MLLGGANPAVVLNEIGTNLSMIFMKVATQYPATHLFINNLYSVSELPNSDMIVPYYNQVLEEVAAQFSNVHVVDVYSAFDGQTRLLLIERNNGEPYQIHPTKAGYRVMTRKNEEVISTVIE